MNSADFNSTSPTFGLQTWLGVSIQKSSYVQDAPRITLSEKVPVTPEFRAGFNDWLREFFGTVPMILKGIDPLTGNTIFFASPAAYEAMLKNHQEAA